MHYTQYDTPVAAYAVLVDADDRILLTWWNGEGRAEGLWSMPGGGVEFDESVEEAVAREVFEETGYEVVVDRPLTTHSFSGASDRSDRPYKSVRLLYEATIVGGSLGTTEVGGSTDFAEWVPLADVPSLAAKADIVDIAYAALTSGG